MTKGYVPEYGYKGIVFLEAENKSVDVAFSLRLSDVVYALYHYTYVGDCRYAIKDKFGVRRLTKSGLRDLYESIHRNGQISGDMLRRFNDACEEVKESADEMGTRWVWRMAF